LKHSVRRCRPIEEELFTAVKRQDNNTEVLSVDQFCEASK